MCFIAALAPSYHKKMSGAVVALVRTYLLLGISWFDPINSMVLFKLN